MVLVLFGGLWFLWSIRQKPAVSVPAGAKAGDFTLQPSEYKTKTATYKTDYGIMVVPENRNKPGSRLIALPIVRICATSANPAEPIFHLGGGPGSSNMGFKPTDTLIAEHDVVLVGYRGADGSSVLNSPEIAAALLGDGQDLASPVSMGKITVAMRAYGQRLEAEGVDLSGYNIPEVVADMESARSALGYERINLLSESYGTRVAQVYAYLHPQSIFRSAMIGVNPPGRFLWEALIIDSQLKQYSHLCARDEFCRKCTTNLAESMRKVAHDMPRRWLFLSIDPGKVKFVSHSLLYYRNTAAMVFDAYLAAEKGDASGLALMSLAYDQIVPSRYIWGDLLAKATIDYNPARDYSDLRAPDTILGSPMALVLWGAASKGLPYYPLEDEFRKAHSSAVETLLINGSVDFSTPVENARDELLPVLKNGKLVTLSELGHCSDFWKVNPSAADHLLISFYDTGTADDSQFGYMPMDFKVSLGFPTLAKILLGTGVLLVVVMVLWFVLWLYKRRNKKNRKLPN